MNEKHVYDIYINNTFFEADYFDIINHLTPHFRISFVLCVGVKLTLASLVY